MEMSVVLRDQPCPGVWRFRIDRPDKRNAIDFQVREELTQAFLAAREDAGCRAIVLGGVAGVFSAGGDVPSMQGLSEEQARERMRHIHVLVRLVATSSVPIVTAAEGVCAGGAVGLALLGDTIVAGSDSKFLFPFFRLGLIPDWASLATLPRRVGVAQARWLMSCGHVINGERAYACGLADDYVAQADVMTAAVERATQLAALPANAWACFKQRLAMPAHELERILQQEQDDQARLLRAAEFQEGFAAFTEKREPDFLELNRA